MSENIDKEIHRLEVELNKLRQLKAKELRAALAALESSMASGSAEESAAPVAGKKRGRPAKAGKTPKAPKEPKAAKVKAPKAGRKGVRGRRPGKRIPDAEALATIMPHVRASGEDGISARSVAEKTGMYYPRVGALLKANKECKRMGKGKFTRFSVK